MSQTPPLPSSLSNPVSGEETNTPHTPVGHTDGLSGTGRATGFQCPACPGQGLAVGTIADRQVAYCDGCGGFVIDSESLGQLIRELRGDYRGRDDHPQPVDSKALHRVRDCPACQSPMATHPYYGPGNVVIDSCGTCQLTWLDASELTQIKKAPGRR